MQRTGWFVIGWIALGGALAVTFTGCVGDDPVAASSDAGPSVAEAGSTDSGTSDDGGVPPLAADAAPPANCPLDCLPPAPPGWTGPSATYDGAEATKPNACPTPYTLPEIDAHQGLAADAATCSCGAPSFAGAKCTATVEIWPTSACNSGTPVADGTASSTACHAVQTGTGAGLRVPTPTLNAGTCSFPSPTKTVPTRTLQKVDVACGLPQAASCAGRADCVASPIPASPFTRLCIHKDGDESCPSADYANRFVAFKTIDDTRDCSACTGTPTGGACGTNWGISANMAQCTTGIAPTTNAANACVSNPGIGALVNIGAMGPSGISCTASGGAATGAATSADPVTFCCNR